MERSTNISRRVSVRFQMANGSRRQPVNSLRASGNKSVTKLLDAKHNFHVRGGEQMLLECHRTCLEQNVSDFSLHEDEILQVQIRRRQPAEKKSQHTGEQSLRQLKDSVPKSGGRKGREKEEEVTKAERDTTTGGVKHTKVDGKGTDKACAGKQLEKKEGVKSAGLVPSESKNSKRNVKGKTNRATRTRPLEKKQLAVNTTKERSTGQLEAQVIESRRQIQVNVNHNHKKTSEEQFKVDQQQLTGLQSQLRAKDEEAVMMGQKLNGLREQTRDEDKNNATLEGELSTQQKRVCDIQSLLGPMDEELNELRRQLQEKDMHLTTLQQEKSSKQQRVSDLQRRLSSKDQELTELQGELEAKDENIVALQGALTEERQRINNLQSELSTKKGEIGSKEREVTELRRELQEKDMHLTTLQQEKSSEQQRIGDLQRRLGSKDQELAEWQKQVRDKDTDLTTLQEEINRTQQHVTGLQSDLTWKDEEITTIQQQLVKVQGELKDKDENIVALQGELIAEKQRANDLQSRLSTKEREIGSKEQEVTELQRELQEKDTNFEAMQEEIDSGQRQASDLQSQLRIKDEEAVLAEQRLNNLQAQLQQKDVNIRTLRGELSAEQQRVSDLQGQLRASDQEIRPVEQRLTVLRQEQDEHRRLRTERQQVLRLPTADDDEENEGDNSSRSPAWVIDRDDIKTGERLLGEGGWGRVFEGKFHGCTVAVKQLHELILSNENINRFIREINIASRCRHPCLLQFIGATTDEESPQIVTELMETSLRALLDERQLSDAEISVISLDVAQALNYLHKRKPAIIHRDISSANVLLWRQGDRWRGKVSDYGAANVMRHSKTIAPGAQIYSAPEALTINQTNKLDVYSFGVLLCEMCIREQPDPDEREEQVSRLTSHVFQSLVQRCLERDAVIRPTMEEIMDELEHFNGSL